MLILIYSLLTAALYCSLMPTWVGFDELYHYGYVQHVATTDTFPVLGKTRLSRELWNSLDYLPVSHYIQLYLERPGITFDEYFRLSDAGRSGLRRSADSMDSGLRNKLPRAETTRRNRRRSRTLSSGQSTRSLPPRRS